jgi:hypothetical protein
MSEIGKIVSSFDGISSREGGSARKATVQFRGSTQISDTTQKPTLNVGDHPLIQLQRRIEVAAQ